jgi:hypothetical protein
MTRLNSSWRHGVAGMTPSTSSSTSITQSPSS